MRKGQSLEQAYPLLFHLYFAQTKAPLHPAIGGNHRDALAGLVHPFDESTACSSFFISMNAFFRSAPIHSSCLCSAHIPMEMALANLLITAKLTAAQGPHQHLRLSFSFDQFSDFHHSAHLQKDILSLSSSYLLSDEKCEPDFLFFVRPEVPPISLVLLNLTSLQTPLMSPNAKSKNIEFALFYGR